MGGIVSGTGYLTYGLRRWVQAGHYAADWAATGGGLLLPGDAGE